MFSRHDASERQLKVAWTKSPMESMRALFYRRLAVSTPLPCRFEWLGHLISFSLSTGAFQTARERARALGTTGGTGGGCWFPLFLAIVAVLARTTSLSTPLGQSFEFFPFQ